MFTLSSLTTGGLVPTKGCHQNSEVFGAHCVGERGRSNQVAEHDRQLTAFGLGFGSSRTTICSESFEASRQSGFPDYNSSFDTV